MPPLRGAGADQEAEGPRFAGDYRLEERLGSGGMGVVHLARSASGLRLAVKVVHAEFAQDEEFRARFRQEVAAARRVSGAFTAPVVDADPDAERPWMATLHIPGPTLAEHVKRNGPLAPGELRRLAAGLAEALRDIHRAGVVHRDLKPSNVLLAADGPKVIDFGISRPADSVLRTETGKLIGTPPFMAPEQFQRPRSVGPAADVFALGSVLVHAARGRGPFDSESPYVVAYQVVHDEADLTGVPADLVPLVRDCLAKEPEARPTPDALMARLREGAPRETGSAPGDAGASSTERSGATHRTERGRVESSTERGGLGNRTERGASESSTARGGAGNRTARGGTTVDPVAERTAVGGLHRARRVAAVVLTAVLVTATGVTLAVRQWAADNGAPVQQRDTAAASTVFRPWHTEFAAPPSTTRPGTPSGTPTASRGPGDAVRAVFCTAAEGALYCAAPGLKAVRLDPADGGRVWSRPAAPAGSDAATTEAAPTEATETGSGTPSPPVLCGGLLHVVSRDGRLLEALDPATGRTRWSRGLAPYGGHVYHAGDTVLLAAPDGTVLALDGGTGVERWRHGLRGHEQPVLSWYAGSPLAYAVTVDGDGSRTLVTAVDPATGEERWSRRLAGALTPVGAVDGVLHLLSRDREQRADSVVRFDPSGGGQERRVRLEVPVEAAAATVRGTDVYLLGYGGALVAVDTGRRAQRWRLETSVSNASPPVATDGRLYFSSADGRLLAVDTARGALLGQTRPRLAAGQRGYLDLPPTPVVAPGRVYGAAPDGTVFALDAADPAHW
ncbi:protein kinase domain-containing protein [Streptomyces sp. URMC 123]|uniref:protein kinase domain-containing protein n=1 Tax=Streptomyces sp. URMC 123 TaxID=3423403 RepID=UPI003F1DFE5F